MIDLSRPVELFGLVASWLCVSPLLFSPVNSAPEPYLAWIALASWFALASLYRVGFFAAYVPRPKLSALAVLLLAVPASALLAKRLLTAARLELEIGDLEACRAALLAAMVFGAAQVLVLKVCGALGTKRTLLARLHPEDLRALSSGIEEDPEASRWIRLRPLEASSAGSGLAGGEAVVISRRSVNRLQDCPELVAAHLDGRSIVDVRQLLKELRGRVDLDSADGWTFLLSCAPKDLRFRLYVVLKKVLEPVLALGLVILLLPLLAAVAAAVLCTSGRPVLYSQERVGYRGRPFRLFKFRTMSPSAEERGARWSPPDDPRVTPLGRWLRRTWLDELPQLFNVMRGDLGFVGPRPERREFYRLLSSRVPLFSLRLLARPGITGWAQVRQGYAASVEACRTKLEYDLYYVQGMSPELDLRVLMETAALMVGGWRGR